MPFNLCHNFLNHRSGSVVSIVKNPGMLLLIKIIYFLGLNYRQIFLFYPFWSDIGYSLNLIRNTKYIFFFSQIKKNQIFEFDRPWTQKWRCKKLKSLIFEMNKNICKKECINMKTTHLSMSGLCLIMLIYF